MRLTATQPDTSASCPCTCHPASHCVLAAQLAFMGTIPANKKKNFVLENVFYSKKE
jgi:hypothetical protein